MHPAIDYHALSDIGKKRPNNEDYWLINDAGSFFTLADGVGGHNAGEVAAKIAADNICALFTRNMQKGFFFDLQLESIINHLKYAIDETNHKVYTLGKENKTLEGMVTTLCCLYFHHAHAIFAHVGDSRIYHLSENILTSLTKDHSLYNKLHKENYSNRSDVFDFPHKNIITKAVGAFPTIEPSIASVLYKNGDLFMMCTDGLTDYVRDDALHLVLNQKKPLSSISKELIEMAKNNNSSDNITVVLIKIK